MIASLWFVRNAFYFFFLLISLFLKIFVYHISWNACFGLDLKLYIEIKMYEKAKSDLEDLQKLVSISIIWT